MSADLGKILSNQAPPMTLRHLKLLMFLQALLFVGHKGR
jgi:hypothetical protein